jgi:hypothetical protein
MAKKPSLEKRVEALEIALASREWLVYNPETDCFELPPGLREQVEDHCKAKIISHEDGEGE